MRNKGLWVFLMVASVACGRSSRMTSSAVKVAPVLVQELNANSSLGKTRLLIYQGEVDPTQVIGQIGDMQALIEETLNIPNGLSVPSKTLSVHDSKTTSPVYLVSIEEGAVVLASFASKEIIDGVKQPIQMKPKVTHSPPVEFCAHYEFRGDDFLHQKFDPTWYSNLQIASRVDCWINSHAVLECSGNGVLFGNYGITMDARKKAETLQSENQAFGCYESAIAYPFHYETQDQTLWRALKVSIRPESNSFILKKNGSTLDPKGSLEKTLQFQETELSFSLGK